MDIKFGTYRHFKGHLVEVIGVAKHSETLEDMVVYRKIEGHPLGDLWVRPKEMFLENVEVNGQLIPRFQFTE